MSYCVSASDGTSNQCLSSFLLMLVFCVFNRDQYRASLVVDLQYLFNSAVNWCHLSLLMVLDSWDAYYFHVIENRVENLFSIWGIPVALSPMQLSLHWDTFSRSLIQRNWMTFLSPLELWKICTCTEI